MIDKLNYQSRTTEVDATSMRMIGAFKSTTLSSDQHLTEMFAALESSTTNLSAATKRTKAESLLEAKDEIRDNAVRSLNYLIVGLVHHPDTEIKTAAQEVEKVFEKYGVTITGESYASESALIVSMLGDLAKPKLLTAIAKLSGCTETIAALQAAQTDFEETRIAYEAEKAQEGTQENATTLKKVVIAIINDKIVVYLRAMALVDEANYGAFARTIATIIADNNEVVKKRKKKEVDEVVE
jgi:hypothetical protein